MSVQTRLAWLTLLGLGKQFLNDNSPVDIALLIVNETKEILPQRYADHYRWFCIELPAAGSFSCDDIALSDKVL